MKPRHRILLLSMVLLVLAACERGEHLDYVIAEGDQPVGRLTVTLGDVNVDTTRQEIRSRGSLTLQAMGQTVRLQRDDDAVIDPRSGQVVRLARRTRLGDGIDMTTMLVTDADSVRLSSPQTGPVHLARDPDLVLEDGLHYGWLLDRLAATGDTTRYRTVDLDRGRVPRVTAVDRGLTPVTVAGDTVLARHVAVRYPGVDRPQELWIDPRDGLMVRSLGGDGVLVYRGRLAGGQRLQAVNLDSLIMVPVDTFIADERAIRAMTVRAVIDLPVAGLTADLLSVPGQRFAGTVRGRRIDGVFTIAHQPFDANRSSVFPTPRGAAPDSVAMYLSPAPLIESEEPAVVARAVEATRNAGTRWQAVQQLTRWCHEAIAYHIPGGGSAAATLAQRRGECGGHSRLLAAMCRAVGIPARVVIGGIYFHDNGGAFGQHAWTEVHLGEAGWIPVDATLGEWEVLDSGHVRLGEHTGFEPVHMKILSFELAE